MSNVLNFRKRSLLLAADSLDEACRQFEAGIALLDEMGMPEELAENAEVVRANMPKVRAEAERIRAVANAMPEDRE